MFQIFLHKSLNSIEPSLCLLRIHLIKLSSHQKLNKVFKLNILYDEMEKAHLAKALCHCKPILHLSDKELQIVLRKDNPSPWYPCQDTHSNRDWNFPMVQKWSKFQLFHRMVFHKRKRTSSQFFLLFSIFHQKNHFFQMMSCI